MDERVCYLPTPQRLGTSYWHAFVVLIVFVGLLSSLFLLAGFEVRTTSGAYPVEYNLLPTETHPWPGLRKLGSDFILSAQLSLSALLLRRLRDFLGDVNCLPNL